MATPPSDLQGKRTRPALMAAIALLAAAAFWAVGPPPIPGTSAPTPTPDATPRPGEAGGFADGSGVGERTAPPTLAPTVSPAAAADGALSVLVYGDEQALGPDGGWPAVAATALQERLRVAPAPWTGARVEVEVVARPGFTAADALTDLRRRAPLPELALVALGWADGGPGAVVLDDVPDDPDRAWWLDELSSLHTHRDVHEELGFYARRSEHRALTPRQHLACMDALGLFGHDAGFAVVYVEQPILDPRADRVFFASTAMRPQPWISLVYGMEQQPEPASLAGAETPLLSPAGHQVVGRFVGVGLVQAAIGGR